MSLRSRRKHSPRTPLPSDAELDILAVLWRLGPSTVREIHETLGKDSGYTTTLKQMQLMTEKGLLVRSERFRSHVYEAGVAKEQTQKEIAADLLKRAFEGSSKNLVLGALAAQPATGEELDEIRRILDKFEKEEGTPMKNLQLLFAQPLAANLGWTLVHFLWQGALISALFAAVRGLGAGPASARARYALACLTLAAMVIAPILTYGFLVGSDTWQSAAQVPAISLSPAAPGGSLASGAPWYSPWLDALRRTLPWLVMAWFTGALVFLIRLAGGSLVAARLRSNANRLAPHHLQEALNRIAVRLGVSYPVRLLVSSLVEVPAVVGWFRPVVLMPAGALTGLAPEYIEALLAHELAHIRRDDYLVNVLQSVVEAVLFYHPAIWWVSNQIRKERELCCDDLAVAASGNALTYARALADLELCRPTHVHAAVAANGGSLVDRIRRLADPSQPVPHTVIGPVAAFVVTLIVLAGAGVVVLRGAQTSAAPGGVVDRSTIFMDTVKRGDMSLAVRGLGKLTSSTTADLRFPMSMVKEVQPGQSVSILFRGRTEAATGKVARITPGAPDGTVTVQIGSELPGGVQPGVDVDGTIELGHLSNVVQVGRPLENQPDSEGAVFKLDPNGEHAKRVKVKFGRASVNTIQILSGLEPGDRVILSDTATFKRYDHITLK